MAAAPPPPPPPPPPGGGGAGFVYDNWWPPESRQSWGESDDNQMALWLAERGLPYENRLYRPHLGFRARDKRDFRWQPYLGSSKYTIGNLLFQRDPNAPGRPWRERDYTPTRNPVPLNSTERIRWHFFNNQEEDDNRLPGRDNRDFTRAEWNQFFIGQLPMDQLRDVDQKYDEDQFHDILSRMMVRAHGEASIRNLHDLVPSALRLRPSAAQRVQEHRQHHAAARVVRDETGPLDGAEYNAQGQYVGAGAGPASAPNHRSQRGTSGN